MPRDLLRVLQRPPFDRYAVIPVARNVWQHVEVGSPAAAARRLIIASTRRRSSARPVSRPGARGDRLVDALLVWLTLDRQLKPGLATPALGGGPPVPRPGSARPASRARKQAASTAVEAAERAGVRPGLA